MQKLILSLLSMCLYVSVADAESNAGFGSSGFAVTAACSDKTGVGPCGILFNFPSLKYFGGQGQYISNNNLFPDGSVSAAYTSPGALLLPVIRGEAISTPTSRISTDITTYQTYQYIGSVETPFALDLVFHYTNSFQGNSINEYPGESFGAIVASVLAGNPFAQQGDRLSLSKTSCFAIASPIATGYVTAAGTSGENSVQTTIGTGCNGNPLMLTPGEVFTVSTLSQFVANRGGFINALGTAEVALSDTLSFDQRSFLIANLVPASGVPDSSTWAMSLLGFGLVGYGMRRRRIDRLTGSSSGNSVPAVSIVGTLAGFIRGGCVAEI